MFLSRPQRSCAEVLPLTNYEHVLVPWPLYLNPVPTQKSIWLSKPSGTSWLASPTETKQKALDLMLQVVRKRCQACIRLVQLGPVGPGKLLLYSVAVHRERCSAFSLHTAPAGPPHPARSVRPAPAPSTAPSTAGGRNSAWSLARHC